MNFIRKLLRVMKYALIRYPRIESSRLDASTVLFLIRTTADFDHMLPIAYKSRQRHPDKNILFVCMDAEFNFKKTHMFRFLVSELKCQGVYVEDLLKKPGLFHRFFLFFINILRPYTFRESYHKWLHQCFIKLNNSTLKNWLYDPRYYEYALNRRNVKTIFIDSVRTRNHRFEYYKLLPTAKNISIRVVLVVHTAPSMKEVVEVQTKVDHDNQTRYSWVDTFLVPSEGHKQWWVSANTPENTIHVVGNTRYSKEWLNVWGRFCGDNNRAGVVNDKRIKIILIEPPWSKIVEVKIFSFS